MEEVILNAIHYGVKVDKEPHLVWIGALPRILDLPPGWVKRLENDDKGCLETYYNGEFDVEIKYPPCEFYLRDLVISLRKYFKKNRHQIEDIQLINSKDGLFREFTINLTNAIE